MPESFNLTKYIPMTWRAKYLDSTFYIKIHKIHTVPLCVILIEYRQAQNIFGQRITTY